MYRKPSPKQLGAVKLVELTLATGEILLGVIPISTLSRLVGDQVVGTGFVNIRSMLIEHIEMELDATLMFDRERGYGDLNACIASHDVQKHRVIELPHPKPEEIRSPDMFVDDLLNTFVPAYQSIWGDRPLSFNTPAKFPSGVLAAQRMRKYLISRGMNCDIWTGDPNGLVQRESLFAKDGPDIMLMGLDTNLFSGIHRYNNYVPYGKFNSDLLLNSAACIKGVNNARLGVIAGTSAEMHARQLTGMSEANDELFPLSPEQTKNDNLPFEGYILWAPLSSSLNSTFVRIESKPMISALCLHDRWFWTGGGLNRKIRETLCLLFRSALCSVMHSPITSRFTVLRDLSFVNHYKLAAGIGSTAA
ncbi:MAG: hypothetical protein NXH95_14440 [Pseudomonadaceae bacterium]|nr:hypothetical protein [Pseudomonadaceae bacterium]